MSSSLSVLTGRAYRGPPSADGETMSANFTHHHVAVHSGPPLGVLARRCGGPCPGWHTSCVALGDRHPARRKSRTKFMSSRSRTSIRGFTRVAKGRDHAGRSLGHACRQGPGRPAPWPPGVTRASALRHRSSAPLAGLSICRAGMRSGPLRPTLCSPMMKRTAFHTRLARAVVAPLVVFALLFTPIAYASHPRAAVVGAEASLVGACDLAMKQCHHLASPADEMPGMSDGSAEMPEPCHMAACCAAVHQVSGIAAATEVRRSLRWRALAPLDLVSHRSRPAERPPRGL